MGTRLADCHPTRPHLANGLCEYCYKKSRGDLPYQQRLSKSGKRADCHPDRKHYAKGLCIRCYQRQHRDANAEKKAVYYERHKKKWKEYNLKSKFDLTLDDYNAMLKKQGGVCAICGGTEGNGQRLSVDHNHESGTVRGLLCQRCNTVIGMSLENTQNLKAAIAYLERHEE